MATPQDKLYFAVRRADGKEWIDLSAWGYVPTTAKIESETIDKRIGKPWADCNPVVRIACFKLTEIEA